MTIIQTIKHSFSTAIGILLAVVAVLVLLAILAYGAAVAHDYVLSRSYDPKPAISKDNDFGPLLVSITITNQDKVDAIAPHPESCYAPPLTTGLRINWLATSYWSQPGYAGQDTSNPKCTFTASYFPGSNQITGTIRLKDRLWLKSVRVSNSILKAEFGSTITSTSTPGLDGKVLNPGQGLSNRFSASFGAGKDGAVVLSANGKNYILH